MTRPPIHGLMAEFRGPAAGVAGAPLVPESGHRRRRAEGMPLLVQKFEANLASRFTAAQCSEILRLCNDHNRLDATPVDKFTDMFVPSSFGV
mgnify:CR=1 FL=1